MGIQYIKFFLVRKPHFMQKLFGKYSKKVLFFAYLPRAYFSSKPVSTKKSSGPTVFTHVDRQLEQPCVPSHSSVPSIIRHKEGRADCPDWLSFQEDWGT